MISRTESAKVNINFIIFSHDPATAAEFARQYPLIRLLWLKSSRAAGIRELALHRLSQKAALLKSKEHGPDRSVWHSSTHTWQHRIGQDDEGSLAGPPSSQYPPSHPTTSVRPSRPRTTSETAADRVTQSGAEGFTLLLWLLGIASLFIIVPCVICLCLAKVRRLPHPPPPSPEYLGKWLVVV